MFPSAPIQQQSQGLRSIFRPAGICGSCVLHPIRHINLCRDRQHVLSVFILRIGPFVPDTPTYRKSSDGWRLNPTPRESCPSEDLSELPLLVTTDHVPNPASTLNCRTTIHIGQLKKKAMRNMVSWVIVKLPHQTSPKGDHIPHEQEYNTRHGLSAIPNEVR